jgi:cholesterol transport system auxiliary component
MKTKQILMMTITGITLFCLVGCLEKQQFAKQRYWLDIQRPKTIANKTSDAILSVEPFSIDSAFRSRSIVNKKATHEYQNDFYQEYLIPPAQMMTEQTCRWLRDSGLFARVLEPGSIMQSTLVLEGHIGKVYVDSSRDNQYVAELEISFYMLEKDKRDKKILFGKTYTTIKPMESSKTEDYFKALNLAFIDILEKYEDDLSSYL